MAPDRPSRPEPGTIASVLHNVRRAPRRVRRQSREFREFVASRFSDELPEHRGTREWAVIILLLLGGFIVCFGGTLGSRVGDNIIAGSGRWRSVRLRGWSWWTR